MLRCAYISYLFRYPAIYIKELMKVTKGIQRSTPYVRQYWNAKFPVAIMLSVTVQSLAFRSVFLVTYSIFSDRQDRIQTNGTLATKIPSTCNRRMVCSNVDTTYLIVEMICNLIRSMQIDTWNVICEGDTFSYVVQGFSNRLAARTLCL